MQALSDVQKAQMLSVALPHKMEKQTIKLLVTMELLLQKKKTKGQLLDIVSKLMHSASEFKS